MAYIGKTPTPAPLTSSDIAADIINNTHIGDTAISGFDALATEPADTDEFLISDGGVLKRLDASLVGGGKIGQIVQHTTNTSASTTNYNSWADSGLNCNITPSATSSKVLILLTTNISGKTTHSAGLGLMRGSTIIGGGGTGRYLDGGYVDHWSGQSSTYTLDHNAFNFLDTPNTTSETNYKVVFACGYSSQGAYFNRNEQDDDHFDDIASMTLIEVLA